MIEQSIELIDEEVGIFLAYGKCFAAISKGAGRVYRMDAMNCAAVLLGGNSEYERFAEGSYFLTPHLALNWREYFLREKDPADPKTRRMLIKWFEPIDRIIIIGMGMDAQRDTASGRAFSEFLEKPLLVVSGSLDFLKKEYDRFLSL